MSWLNDLFGVREVSDADAQAQLDAYNKQAAAYAAREAGAYGGQSRLANNLWGVINGQGPSVSGTQLQQGLDQTLADANSVAGGGTGVNGALARYAAILGAGRSMAATNQAQALARVNEEATARAQLGGVLGAQAGESGNLYGTDVGASGNAAGLKASIDQNNQKADAALSGAFLSGISQLGSSALTAFGGPPGAAPVAAPVATAAAVPVAPAPVASNYGSLYSAAQPGYAASTGIVKPPAPYGGAYGGGYGNPYGDRY